jgi:hypothetical protein
MSIRRKRNIRNQQVVRAETRQLAGEPFEAAQQKSSAYEQQESETNLGDD